MVEREGITSIKLYMTYPAMRLGDGQMLDVMLRTRELGMSTMIHAENAEMIDLITRRLIANQQTLPKNHAIARPQIAESEATHRAIALSTLTSTPILLVHLSSKQSLDHVRHAQMNQLLPVHAETCPHYLYLLSSKLESTQHHVHGHEEVPKEVEDEWAGARHVCAPPLRHSDDDLQGVWDAVSNGTVNVISSDHAPSLYDHRLGKRKPIIDAQATGVNATPTFKDIPNGLPGIETRLPLLFHAATSPSVPEQRRVNLPHFVALTSTNAARMYGLAGRKGSIAPGFDADLCIWYPEDDPRGVTRITNGMLHHAIDYTPYEKTEVCNWPRWTILRGQVAWDRDVELVKGKDAGLLGRPGDGKFLKRGKGEIVVGRVGNEVPGMRTGERSVWM
jgi:dihydropyrimidinase